MTTPDLRMQQCASQQRRNLRVGLTLAAVALAVFIGFILRFWLLGK